MFTIAGCFIGAVLVSMAGRVIKGRALMGLAFLCALIVLAVFGTAGLSPDMAAVYAEHREGPLGETGIGWVLAAMTAAATVALASPFILLAERR